MEKFKNIYEGWKNHLFPAAKLKELIKEVSDERLSICRVCPVNSIFDKIAWPVEHCTECGCVLSAKTKSFSSECPLGKWKAYMEREQELDIYNNNKEIYANDTE